MSERVNTAQWLEKQKRWQIKVQKDGVRKTFTSCKHGLAGKREAEAKADKWLDEGVRSFSTKVKNIYPIFQEESKELVGESENAHVAQFGKNWILPYMGECKIAYLKDSDVEKVLQMAAKKGLSRKTVQDIKAMVFKFIKWSRKHGYTTYRPDDVSLPQCRRKKQTRILQPRDIAVLLREDTTVVRGKRVKDELIHAYRVQLLTAMRPGEMRAIKQSDYLDGGLNICGAINAYGTKTLGKNENAIRRIELGPLAQKEVEAQLREYPSRDGFLFQIPPQNTYNARLRKYCESNGITVVTTYELRHTFVSHAAMVLREGEVKPIVGHSRSMDTFGTYGHEVNGSRKKAAETMDRLFLEMAALSACQNGEDEDK